MDPMAECNPRIAALMVSIAKSATSGARAEREHGKSQFDQSPSAEMTRPDSIAASCAA